MSISKMKIKSWSLSEEASSWYNLFLGHKKRVGTIVGGNTVFVHGSHMDWKTWKNEKLFPVREKSGNFEHTGKVTEFNPKYGNMGEFYPKCWKNEEILASLYMYTYFFLTF